MIKFREYENEKCVVWLNGIFFPEIHTNIKATAKLKQYQE